MSKKDKNEVKLYIARNSIYTEFTRTYAVQTIEFEYDDDLSIFERVVFSENTDETEKQTTTYWLGYVGATRQFYLAYPKTLKDAFKIIDDDYEWFRSQLTDVYKSESLETK